jgi:hypothetical protein
VPRVLRAIQRVAWVNVNVTGLVRVALWKLGLLKPVQVPGWRFVRIELHPGVIVLEMEGGN